MPIQEPVPIAIIGMGCRFPGGANSPEELWKMLSEKRSGWCEVPPDRWNAESFHHPHAEAKDGIDVHGGNFLDQDISLFEPAFFGISGNEAESIDPQQRILLETTYEALENAGIPQESIRGSDTGVYMAYFAQDYDRMVFKDPSDIPKQHITGGGAAIVSNRISYVWDLKGPSMTVDTGCSGSLVALHLACQSLRMGESAMSIVGGVNLHLAPDYDIAMSFVNVLNKDGKCYTFDSRGSGYGRGEGSATVVLKRLDEALANGDSIRGVIRNTAINQDGKTNGISLPNKQAQKDLVQSIYQSAGLDPVDTGYVEAHGTGTIAGDSAEVESIAEIFCKNGGREDELFVGSVKSNIGHLEAASGIAGLIKAVLVLEKGLIPPNINFEVPKVGLNMEARRIKVPLKMEPWSKSGLRRASINSYGYGGTNCHAILEAAPTGNHKALTNGVKTNKSSVNGTNGIHPMPNGLPRKATDEKSDGLQLFVMTAKSQKSLPRMLENLRQDLLSHDGDESYIRDLGYTLSCRRSLLQWRSCITAANHHELVAALGDPKKLKIVKSKSDVSISFIFTGQGAQWHAMGRQLIARYSTFRNSLETSARILTELGARWNLIEELMYDASSSRVNQSDISQPVTTAIQIALVDLLFDFNVKPQAVLGHSSSEIAAAYAVGVLSQDSALMISYHRGFVATAARSAISRGGSMLAVGLGESEITPYMDRLRAGTACIACENSPSSTTVSGDMAAIDELKALLDDATIFNRKLKVDVAYHSHHMRKVAGQYLQSIEGLVASDPHTRTKFFSSVTGKQKPSGFGANYWVENLVSQVKFRKGLEELRRSQQTECTLIEIGPHSALQGPIRQTMSQPDLESLKYSYLPTLLRDKDSVETILDLSRNLFESGCPVDLSIVNSLNDSKQPFRVVSDLLPYSWDHSIKYWRESRLSRDDRLRPHPSHDLLGLRIVSSTINEPTWRHIISVDSLPWLKDHVVDNSVIFPGSGYLCMAIEGIRQITQDRRATGTILNYVLKDVSFTKALIVPDSPGTVEILLTFKPSIKTVADRNSSMREDFRISSLAADKSWREHCSGSIAVEFSATTVDEVEEQREEQFSAEAHQEELDSIKNKSHEEIDANAMYKELAANGNAYGPSFALMKYLTIGECQGLATVEIPDVEAIMPAHFLQRHVIHPTTLDALMQIEVPLFNQNCGIGAIMPVFAGELVISASISTSPGTRITVTTKVAPGGSNSLSFKSTAFQLRNGVQTAVVHVSNGELQRIGGPLSLTNQTSERKLNYSIEWKPDVNFLPKDPLLSIAVDAAQNESSPQQRMKKLDCAASLYIRECLMKINDESPRISKKHHVELFDWMKRYSTSEDCKTLLEGISALDNNSSFAELESLDAEGEMLSRLGGNLESILLGKLDALSLMLEEDLLYRVYAENMSIQQCYLHMAEYLKLLSFKEPFMKVLEIGAGTGSATVHVLEALSHQEGMWLGNYVFTDISSGFFEKAKPKFEEFAGYMDYKMLDIERDPTKQGFEIESYDLIVASNVLHATSSIEFTLKNVRKLLKPGGRLILVELTRLRPYLNITFGTLSGWWAFEDDRKDCPLLSLEGWNKALLKNSFNGVEVAVDDYKSSAQTGALIVSKALLSAEKAALAPVEVICTARSRSTVVGAFANELLSAVKKTGFSCAMRSWPSQVRRDVIYVIIDNGEKPVLVQPSQEQFYQITALTTGAESVLWLTVHEDSSAKTNPEKGLITGLARVARTENDNLKFLVVDVQQSVSRERENVVSAMSKLLNETFGVTSDDGNPTETEYIYNNEQLQISRALPNATFDQWMDAGRERKEVGLFHQPGRFLKLHVETPGLLDSLVFINDALVQKPIGRDEIEIETKAHGVNFKDVYIALGQMKPTERMTGESAGIVTRVGFNFQSKFKIGDRVCGWGSLSPFATRSRVLGNCSYPLPASMSFTTAASIPVVFLTAYIGLVRIAKLQKGQIVLIHAASGGVGQAAIMIAQQIGAEIIATVGSSSKSNLLSEHYGIPKSHIFSSRLRTFKQGVLRLTQGRGVDAALNSLSGEFLHDTFACIAPCGTFVEIGKADILKRNQLSMVPFDNMVTFASLDLGIVKDYRSDELASAFAEVMSMFEKDILRPVEPITAINISNIEEAFRLIQARKHRGKIVLSSDDDAMVKIISIRPPLKLMGDATFVIAGGLGDLGRRICHFLAKHGAKHIVTLSRRNLDPEVRQAFEDEIRTMGAEIHVFSCDIIDNERVHEIASVCKATLPPVRGIIQAAMILRDRNLEKMKYDEFMTAVRPKFDGTRNVREAFANPLLESFIMLSSIAAILGNPGQGNYASGCAYEDALANIRDQPNTKFISLNLGLVEGSYIDTPERRAYLLAQGAAPVEMNELFSLLEYSLSSQARKDACNQIISRLDKDSLSKRLGNLLKFPMLSHLQQVANKDLRAGGTVSMDVEGVIATASSREEIHDIISKAIVTKISSLVALEAEDINMEVTVAELGLDSLVAIELKNWIVRNLLAQIQTVEILDMSSLRQLAATIMERSALVAKPDQADAAENQGQEIEASTSPLSSTNHSLKCCRTVKELRKLPLYDLSQIMQSYLLGIRHLVTEEEYANSVKATEEFQEPRGSGQQLYSQLKKMHEDPAVENWLEDLYLQSMYLSRRSPTALYYDIMGTFGEPATGHTQAETAAIISVAAFNFKKGLDAGQISPVHLNEMPLCMESQNWLFNTTRVPRPGFDEVQKFSGAEYDYLIALRLGHFFKLSLTEGDKSVSHEELRSTFQHILDLELEDSWVGLLTAEERDSWATARSKLLALLGNEETIRVIDSACFLVCLDDICPSTPEERIRNFMLDRGINRWHDKSLQFLVAKNASAAFIADHTKLDGGSVHQVLDSVKKAILAHRPDPSLHTNAKLAFQEVKFEIDMELQKEISRMRETWSTQCADIDYANLDYKGFGASYLKGRRCNPPSAFEVVAQLASFMIFGSAVACWQPVNMSHYHRDRVEIIQTMTATMFEFCNLAMQDKIPIETCRKLFFEAAREHASSMMRAQKGEGYHRTLTAMEMLAKQQGFSDENMPSLYSDPAFCKTGPENIMTGPRDGLLSEVASVWPKEESLFVNYEVYDDGARFSIVGHHDRAQKYRKLLEKAAGIVKSILDE